VDDIVERLLNAAGEIFPGRFMSFDGPLLTEAADEIQRLRTEIDIARYQNKKNRFGPLNATVLQPEQ
jgi:hypothetical protein